jgi:bifunctional non-homologous end joining protein LigD
MTVTQLIAAVAGDQVRLYTRHGKDWADRFQPLVEPLQKRQLRSTLLDGEVVVMDESGRTDFGALQRAMEEGNKNLTYVVFDLLQLDGEDLRRLPLRERKARLEKLLGKAAKRGPIRVSEYSQGEGRQAFAQACRLRFEGLVSKRIDAPYRSGERTRDWLKVKCVAKQEFVIGGWSESDRDRLFASLLLGTWQNAKLHYAGRVGTGFDEHDVEEIGKKVRALEIAQPPFVDVPRAIRRRAHWAKPVLVAQVRYTELTRDGIVRHGVFEGLREDKPGQEVTMERPVELSGQEPSGGRKRAAEAERIAGVLLTHPDKVLYPKMGITKRDLASYLAAVAPHMLPHVKDRPLSVVRCPEGRHKTCFFQRHAMEGMPESIDRVTIRGTEGKADYIAVGSAAGLVACAQMGALELHIWGVRKDDLERPDRLVFDLDPAEDVPFEAVRGAARQIKELLAGVDLEAFALLTGSKGVHLVIPLLRRHEWPVVSGFAKSFAEHVAALDPERFIATMTKARRRGRIFIDHLRNHRTASAIAPYSPRANEGGPVAMPVDWHELVRLDGAGAFTLWDALARLERDKAPWAGYFKTRQSLTVKSAAALGIELQL